MIKEVLDEMSTTGGVGGYSTPKAFAKKGFITRAIQDLQQLKVERPDNTTVGVQLGLLHYSQGNLVDAQIEWESVLGQDPVNREAIAYLELLRKN